MPFDVAKWDQLCRAELDSLRSTEAIAFSEAAMFRHMRSRFETICRRMCDAVPMQQQPSAQQGPSGFGQWRFSRNENEFAAKRGRFNGPNGGQGGSKGVKKEGSKGASGGKKAQPSAVVPDKVRVLTNSEEQTSRIFRPRPNMEWTVLETYEQLKVELRGIAEKAPIVFVVWHGAFGAECLQELKTLCEAKATFFRLITQDSGEAGNFLEHIVMPTGRALLKEAQDAGLKPTVFPLS